MHFHDYLPTSFSGCSQTPQWNHAAEENTACFFKLNTSEPVVCKPHMVLEALRTKDERKSLKPRHRRSVQLHFPSVTANCVSYPLFSEPSPAPSIIWCLSFNPHYNRGRSSYNPISQMKTQRLGEVTFPSLSRL